MANKAMIQRELKRQNLVMKYAKKRAILKEKMKVRINWVFKNPTNFFLISKKLFNIKDTKNLSNILKSVKKLKFNRDILENLKLNLNTNSYFKSLKKLKFLIKFDLYKLINFIYFRLSIQHNKEKTHSFIQFINYLNKNKLKLISKYNLIPSNFNYQSNLHVNYLHYILKNDLQKPLYLDKNQNNKLTELITNFRKTNQHIVYTKKYKKLEKFNEYKNFEDFKEIKFKNFYISEQYVTFRFIKWNLTSIKRWKRTTKKQKFIPKE